MRIHLEFEMKSRDGVKGKMNQRPISDQCSGKMVQISALRLLRGPSFDVASVHCVSPAISEFLGYFNGKPVKVLRAAS